MEGSRTPTVILEMKVTLKVIDCRYDSPHVCPRDQSSSYLVYVLIGDFRFPEKRPSSYMDCRHFFQCRKAIREADVLLLLIQSPSIYIFDKNTHNVEILHLQSSVFFSKCTFVYPGQPMRLLLPQSGHRSSRRQWMQSNKCVLCEASIICLSVGSSATIRTTQ